MIRRLPIAIIALVTLGLASCDFPSDPPILPQQQQPQDDYLVNLSAGYRYAYIVGKSNETEQQLGLDTVKTVTAPMGEYYRVVYDFLDYSGEDLERVVLLVPFMRNAKDGLECSIPNPPYKLDELTQENEPTMLWKFPYPATAGATWVNPDRPWRVDLVATDTLVVSTDDVQSYKCHAYHITYTGYEDPMLFYRVFVVPNEAIFKIENVPEDIIAVTYFWALPEE